MTWPGVSRNRRWMVSGAAAGKPGTQRGGEGLGEDGEHDVQVDVEVDGGRQGVGAERADDFREPLFDGHPAGVLGHERPGLDVVVVGDDDGRRLAAQPGDHALATGSGGAPQPDAGAPTPPPLTALPYP